jgi:ubiquitin C
MVFKISIGAFFIADATLSIMMPPKMGSALVYFSCFLLVLVSYLLLVSFNKYYGYAILPAPLPIVAALLQHKLLSGLMRQQRINSEGDQQNGDIEVSGQAHDNGEEYQEHFDHIFELSADIVNCGGLITVVFGNSMVGPVTAVGFLFFYTMALGLYLMMVTTVRTAVLNPHARYLAILLKVLLMITLITALIHGVRH